MMWNELRGMRGAVMALAVAVGGCSSVGLGDVSPVKALAGAVNNEATIQANQEKFAVVAVCPEVQVRDGTQLLQVFDPRKPRDASGLRFQASIQKFARECHTNAVTGDTTIKVGVFGRMLAGPNGATGTAALPLRIVMTRNGDEVLYSQLYKINATVAPGASSTEWTQIVSDLVVPGAKSAGNFVIYVGFDEGAKK